MQGQQYEGKKCIKGNNMKVKNSSECKDKKNRSQIEMARSSNHEKSHKKIMSQKIFTKLLLPDLDLKVPGTVVDIYITIILMEEPDAVFQWFLV